LERAPADLVQELQCPCDRRRLSFHLVWRAWHERALAVAVRPQELVGAWFRVHGQRPQMWAGGEWAGTECGPCTICGACMRA
jgi:hypothetical protein